VTLYLRMLSYLKPYKWRVIQVLVLSFVTVALSVGSLGAMKPLFDTLFARGARVEIDFVARRPAAGKA